MCNRSSTHAAFIDVDLGIAKDRAQALQYWPSTPLNRGGHCIVNAKSFVPPFTRFVELSVSNNGMVVYTSIIFFVCHNIVIHFLYL